MDERKKSINKAPLTINERDLVTIRSTPVLVLNPTASKEAFKDQAQTNLTTMRSLLDTLPDEALSQFEQITLIYIFNSIERLACELQEFLIES